MAAVSAALLFSAVRAEAQTPAPPAPPKPAGEVPPPPPPVTVQVPATQPTVDGPPVVVPAPPAPPAPPSPRLLTKVPLVADGVAEFARCDGFGAPNRNGDGMTVMAGQLGNIFVPSGGHGDTTKSDVRVSADGVRMCDAALASPNLLPAYDLRRASLLRARAVHKLAAGDMAGATADIAASRAAIGPSAGPLYDRSMAIGTDYVEAFALALDGKGAEAAALARATFDKRRYSRQSAVAAWLVLERAGRKDELEAHLRALARLHPEAIAELHMRMLQEGRWADAAALYPQLKAPRPPQEPQRYGYYAQNTDLRERVFTETWRLRRGAWHAYALAAAGQPAEARAALAAARERLAKATEPPVAPTIPKGKKRVRPSVQERYEYETEVNASLRERGGVMLDTWAVLVEGRAALAEGDLAKATSAAETKKIADVQAWRDLRAAVAERLPAAEKARFPTAPVLPIEVPAVQALGVLMEALPEAERLQNLPRFEAKASGWGGWSIDARDDGTTKISFHSVNATAPSAVEEMALLRAADLALKAGKPGLIVTGRYDAQHTTQVVTYGVPGPPIPSGYSSELEVVFVDPAALPPAFQGGEWRVLDAEAVYAELEPHYPSKAEVRTAREAERKKKGEGGR